MRSVLRHFWTLVTMNYRADPTRASAVLVLGTIERVLPLLAAFFIRVIVDGVVQGAHRRVVVAAWALGLAATGMFVLTRLSRRQSMVLIEKSTERYDREIIRLSS